MWTTGGSAYIQSRMMGSSTKVSLHDQGESQWSMTSEWYVANMPNSPNRGRHIVRWQAPEPGPGAAAHLFRVVIPESELRPMQASEDLKRVSFLPPPAPDHALNVECYITPPVKDPTFHCPYQHLASLPLTRSQQFVALLHELPVQERDKRQLAMLRAAAASTAGGHIRPEFRGVGFFQDSVGVRGVVEFVPYVEDEAA
jgi:hypothetical protein